jgi:hypothetical protein
MRLRKLSSCPGYLDNHSHAPCKIRLGTSHHPPRMSRLPLSHHHAGLGHLPSLRADHRPRRVREEYGTTSAPPAQLPSRGSKASPLWVRQAASRQLSQGWQRMGTLAANTPARGRRGHSDLCLSPIGHPIRGIPRRKAASPRDRSDGLESYMNWPSRVWSASPA